MRLLIDQNLPRSLARRMTDAGHAAAHTGELGLEKATDPVVFAATGDLMELSGHFARHCVPSFDGTRGH